jgi:hypothetical protein
MLLFTVFFSIYLLGNFYILWRLGTLFGIRRGWLLYLLVAIVTFFIYSSGFTGFRFCQRPYKSFMPPDGFVDGSGIIITLCAFDL